MKDKISDQQLTPAERKMLKTKILFGLNTSRICVSCKYLHDCRWLQESGSWCVAKADEVAEYLTTELVERLSMIRNGAYAHDMEVNHG